MGATTVVVLAGGASRRMGDDKRLLRLFPTSLTFTERTIAVGRLVTDRVAVVGGAAPAEGWGRADTIPDSWPAEGPLGALLTAFQAFPDDQVVVLAADYPLLQAGLVQRIVAGAAGQDAAIAVEAQAGGGRRHPLIGVYQARRCVGTTEALFKAGERSMGALLDRVTLALIGGDEGEVPDIHRLSLTNVNTPVELAQLRMEGLALDREQGRRRFALRQ